MFFTDHHFIEIFIDLYINMAAGWFGAIFIFVPANIKKHNSKSALLVLIYNAIFGILSIVTAYRLKLMLP